MKITIVLPAYNAASTIKKTYDAIPNDYKKNVILVDDFSEDDTVAIAKKLNIKVINHDKNKGYGGNQKTCYKNALESGADIIVMLHPDYQYPPEFIAPMVDMIKTGYYDCVLGSRILSGEALRGNMPLYKYVSNRVLTFIENLVTGAKLSEYHTGFRAFKREILESIDFEKNSDAFIFDNQIILQMLARNYRIGEISCPCRYFAEASSINFLSSVFYGLQCLWWGFVYMIGRFKLYRHPLFFSKT